ncbi:MAG: radical SAM protein [Candidatus Falkowbacteria bacterium]|nr:radical SAM protein [Candidatus Falkowbacteria bacterium]
MKIFISYPPLISEKGIPLLSQNRQFQWFNSPTYIYPVIPAYLATLLKEAGHEVVWDDGIAEGLRYGDWEKRLLSAHPDLIFFETKTPVVKRHWAIINDLKTKLAAKIVLLGDHVTAEPEESLRYSKVDYVLAGGDYDFGGLNLVRFLAGEAELEPGWHWRTGGEWQATSDNQEINWRDGEFKALKAASSGERQNYAAQNLDTLPMIDRELTNWRLYAYKNGNFKYMPGAYLMNARDCWWGRCSFCLTGEAQVLTIKGAKNIADIEKGDRVLTHLGNYKKVNETLKRNYEGELIEIKTNCLMPFKITPNHQVLNLPLKDLSRCLKVGQAGYLCKSNNDFSKRLDCANCELPKPYLNYKPQYIEAGQISKGDYLAVPINREIIKTAKLDLKKILNLQPTIINTWKKIADSLIKEILTLNQQGKSERDISVLLKIDRETVHRYISLEKAEQLINKSNPLKYKGGKISFEGGKNWLPADIVLKDDVYRLFGYYLAEGCVSKLKNRPNSLVISLTFNQKEREYIADVKKIFEDIFKVEVNINQNKVNHTTQITVGNSLLAKVFKNLFGDNCYNKSLPEFIMKAERVKQVELLRGIFRGDAHYRQRGTRAEYILSSASDSLSSQLVMLLLRCSAIPSVRRTKIRGKMTKEQNIITLSSIDIINLFAEKKRVEKVESLYKKGFIIGNYAYLPVTRLKKEQYKGAVYNLSVDKDHSYTANFVGVSNCSWTTLFPGQTFRVRSARLALDEVGQLIDLGVKEIMEDSGTLPVGPWLEEFCNGMIERGYNKKIVMSCNMRISGIKDPEIWKLMKRAGFRFILFGLESANQKTLDAINKNLKVEEIEPGLRMCKEAGLEPHITAMIGYPWETYEDAKKTVELAKDLFKKNCVNTLQGTVLIPYPGTPLYAKCWAEGLLNFTDYDRFDQREQVMKCPLTTEQVKELTQGLYKAFMSPKFVINKLKSIRSWSDIKFLWMAGMKVLGHLTDFSKK